MQDAGVTLREPHSEPWHGISSPAAREVVEAVSRRLSQGALEHYSYPVSDHDGSRLKIRRRLERSQLAQRIAGGADMLPSIEDYMPLLLRPFLNRTYRRRPGTLAVHVMEHLRWYLCPPRQVVMRELSILNPPRSMLIFLLGSVLLGALAIIIDGARVFFGGAAVLLLLGWIICGLEYTGQVQDYDIRCAEFFRYLVDTYADAPEDGH